MQRGTQNFVRAFTFLSLNLHGLKLDGTSFRSNQERFAAIANAVEAEKVDAIAIQELCEGRHESGLTLLLDALRNATGADWFYHRAFAHQGWTGTHDEADEYVGLFSRTPFSEEETLVFHSPGVLRRVAVGALLQTKLGPLRCFSTHLEYDSVASRVQQAKQLATHALAHNDPTLNVLIAGDFNATTGTDTHESFRVMGYHDFSAGLSSARIDHVFVHRSAPIARDHAERIFIGGKYPVVSDHPGILVHLAPGKGEPVVRTHLVAHIDVGLGHHVYFRGTPNPLHWDEGLPGRNTAGDCWELLLTECEEAQSIECKVLRDDKQWQSGPNVVARAGKKTVWNAKC